MELRRGDLIEVKWLDIFEDPVGNPDTAEVATRLSIGYFWGERVSAGQPAFITTTTIDTADEGTNGYCIYPLAVILSVRIVRRGAGKKYRASKPVEFGSLRTEHVRRKKSKHSGTDPDVPASKTVGVGGEQSGDSRRGRDSDAEALGESDTSEAEGIGRQGSDHR